jgi:hypothetical protein
MRGFFYAQRNRSVFRAIRKAQFDKAWRVIPEAYDTVAIPVVGMTII